LAWGYDNETGKDLPNQYAISMDNGKTFTEPMSTGLIGQTLTPVLLNDGRILSIYRRTDKSGLWANISRIESGTWVNEYEEPLWGYGKEKLIGAKDNLIENFNVLRFGAPYVIYEKSGLICQAILTRQDYIFSDRKMQKSFNEKFNYTFY